MAPPPTAGEYGPGPAGGGGPGYVGRPGQVGMYEDVTGQFDLPNGAGYYSGGPMAYGPGAPSHERAGDQMTGGVTRDTWVRIVIWVIPLIFMSGALYFNIQSTAQRQDAVEEQVKLVSERVNAMASDARVLQETVSALRSAGDRIPPQLDALKEQLSGLRSDLAAIREKLGIGDR